MCGWAGFARTRVFDHCWWSTWGQIASILRNLKPGDKVVGVGGKNLEEQFQGFTNSRLH